MLNIDAKKEITLENYRGIIEDSLYEEIIELSEKLKGIRICHINATSYGGGVAEILHQEIPLARSLGLKVSWKVISADPEFFDVTKKVHNALQGGDIDITDKEWHLYEACNIDLAKKVNTDDFDVIFIHDPQPAKIISCLEKGNAKWVWRCHIDTSAPNKKVAEYFLKFLNLYDASIFTLKDYVFKGFGGKTFTIPPAIDPLSDKNRLISKEKAGDIIQKFGVGISRLLIAQVSRFDPWKDPLGVIDAYRLVKEKIPEVQLAYVGSMADDDPEAQEIFKQLKKHVGGDEDVFLLSNLDGVHDLEINAFQTYPDVVLQKSLKEGFGLTVSEALWKGTPVIGGDVGGIPMQIRNGVDGFLVNDINDCAKKIIYLLENKNVAAKMGQAGREHVRKNFLLPRLLRDELILAQQLLFVENSILK